MTILDLLYIQLSVHSKQFVKIFLGKYCFFSKVSLGGGGADKKLIFFLESSLKTSCLGLFHNLIFIHLCRL